MIQMPCAEFSESDNNDTEELKEAIKSGDKETVADLLDSKADLQHCYANGITPLHLAVVHEQLEVVKLLMLRGADPMARTTDECRLSPVDLAHVQNHQEILDALCEEGACLPCERRFTGPGCLLLLLACNAAAFYILQREQGFDSNSTFNVALLVLVSLFLCGLALSNGLDPGAVDPDEVQYLKEWRTSPEVKVTLPRDPTEDEIFVVETSDEEEKEPYRWCRSCNLWRPPGVSHCSECRKCFWRMDHHCWLIGNCVAMRNHRFFTLMVVCGCLAWTSVLVKTLWDFFLEETHRNFLEFEWFDIIAVLFIVWSLLGLAFLVPFSLFHVSALLCNITSKNACGHRRISWTSRRMNGFEEYDQIFCGPLQMRPCQEHRSIHMQPRETTNG